MSIPIPGLPTDNLYKFLALAGVLLVAVSGYLQIEAGIVEQRWELDMLNISQIEYNSIKASSDAYDRYRMDTAKADSAMSAIALSRDSVKSKADSVLYVHLNEWWPWKLLLETKIVDYWMWYGGWAIMAFGFFMWYWKLQRHQDAILRQQAEDSGASKKGTKHRD